MRKPRAPRLARYTCSVALIPNVSRWRSRFARSALASILHKYYVFYYSIIKYICHRLHVLTNRCFPFQLTETLTPSSLRSNWLPGTQNTSQLVSYTISADRKYLLLVCNVRRLYRHTQLAQYTVYDIQTRYVWYLRNSKFTDVNCVPFYRLSARMCSPSHSVPIEPKCVHIYNGMCYWMLTCSQTALDRYWP